LSSKAWDSANLGLFAGDVGKASRLAANVADTAVNSRPRR
jgi:hypothetical protein